MANIEQTLRDLGLNEKEIKIYLTILPLGRTPASFLAKKTGFTRSTAQYVCQQLQKKGLLSLKKQGNIFLFKAEPPEKLIYLLDQEIEQLSNKRSVVNRIIGEIITKMNPNTEIPRVKFYEGREEIKNLFKKIVSYNEAPVDSLLGKGESNEYFPETVEEFIKIRLETKSPHRIICPSTNNKNKTNAKELRKVKHINVKNFPFAGNIKICADTVNIFSFKRNQEIGVSIQNQDIADNFRILFNYMWKGIK